MAFGAKMNFDSTFLSPNIVKYLHFYCLSIKKRRDSQKELMKHLHIVVYMYTKFH